MSQFLEHGYQQPSPVSYSGTSVDAGNVGNTPTSRSMAFSPGSNSVKSVSKIIHTPDRDGSDGKHAIFSPTSQSSGGFRTTGIPVDRDPFVTPATQESIDNQSLSATASSFRPYDMQQAQPVQPVQPVQPTQPVQPVQPMQSAQPAQSAQSGTEGDYERGRTAEQISPALSNELLLSRCIELSTSAQVPTNADVDVYLAKLASLGSPCQGQRQVFLKNGKAYIRFTNIRDACVTHRNVHLCGPDWIANFVSPPDFAQLFAPGESMATVHEGQLDLLAVLLHNATMKYSQVEPFVFKILQAEGDIFAFRKHPRSDDGMLKAVIEFADINTALNVATKLNGVMVDGLHIRLSFFQPDGSTGRAIAINDRISTPMPTPMRYSQEETQGYQGHTMNTMGTMGHFTKPQQAGNNAMPPLRHQATPPTSGMGGPPQVALVPMVLRNPYTPGTPIILDPYGGHGNMTPMPGGSPIVFPPGASVSSIMGHHGFDRNSTMASRYANRRGGAMRIERAMHYNPNGHHNQVDINRIREGVDVRTTIMLRNIPNKVDQRMLKAIVDESSWGKYDFMYLRIDFANDCNVGYAFINFADPLDIVDFAKARDNQRWNCFRSDKVAEISYATIQGRDCLVQKFRNSSVMLEAAHYRPKLYYTVNGPNPELAGQEEEFPGPDNPSKMKRSCENAEHVGLFTPHLSQYYRDEQRRRRSQYDRGTRMAALEEYDYETTLQQMYMPH